MVRETKAEASSEANRAKKGKRCVQRTVDLSDAEIANVEVAEMTPQPEPSPVSTAVSAGA